MKCCNILKSLKLILVSSVFLSINVYANDVDFSTTELDKYLLVGQVDAKIAEGVKASNQELGRVSKLPDSAPAVTGPGIGPEVSDTPTYDGNVAITSNPGKVNMSDMDVYGSIGVDCASSWKKCADKGGFFSNTKYDQAAGGAGLTDIDRNNGVNVDVDLSALTSEIGTAKDQIANLSAETFITTDSGLIDQDTVVQLEDGLNVISFSGVGDNDVLLDNSNLIFQGGIDSMAIVIVPESSNFLVSQGNLVIGDGGIGLNNVLIVTLKDDNDTHIDLQNSIVNGVALWDLSMGEGEVSFDNVGGCTQVVGDKLNFNDVNLNRCGFSPSAITPSPVPVPAAIWLFGTGLATFIGLRKKANIVKS
ncbi:MAG: PEP-CTERM sorting domain-containing protein [Gammaproteobacteria bacterium]|nr:MAG: PEP-CTERM sorting domain-containing protein [Gammaproteobacteria bacterium]